MESKSMAISTLEDCVLAAGGRNGLGAMPEVGRAVAVLGMMRPWSSYNGIISRFFAGSMPAFPDAAKKKGGPSPVRPRKLPNRARQFT
jgi:hypothetical protein